MASSNPVSSRTEIDTSPFEPVNEVVNQFGGKGICIRRSAKSSELMPELVDKLEEEAARLERDLVAMERETMDVLKEVETTKNTAAQLKSRLQKEENPHSTSAGNGNDGFDLFPSSAPGLVLLQLQQAKLNIARSITTRANLQATIDQYHKKIELGRASLEKTRRRITSNTSKISFLEEELNKTRLNRAEIQDDITLQLQQLSSETKQFKKVGQAAKIQAERAMSEIEQTRVSIKTTEVRLIAAKRMKEVAQASERKALAEIRSLTKKSIDPHQESEIGYSSLVSKANVSRAEVLKREKEALREAKRALKEAKRRAEIANMERLEAEEGFRALRSDQGHKRFQRSHSSPIVSNEVNPVSTATIGEILHRRITEMEEYENVVGKGKMCKPRFGKRKKLRFCRTSALVVKIMKKN